MNKLIAIVSFALSLYGCDFGGNTYVHRSRAADGSDVLHSRVVARPGLARFECVGSASGECHYTLYAPDCTPASAGAAPDPAACLAHPVQRFALARGESRQVAAPSRFRMCVGTAARAEIAGCAAPEPLAVR